MASEFISLADAAKLMGISRTKLWLLLKNGVIPTYADPKDARRKLVRRSDIETYLQPKQIGGPMNRTADGETSDAE